MHTPVIILPPLIGSHYGGVSPVGSCPVKDSSLWEDLGVQGALQHVDHPELGGWALVGGFREVIFEYDQVCLLCSGFICDKSTGGHWALLLQELAPACPNSTPGGQAIPHQHLLQGGARVIVLVRMVVLGDIHQLVWK